MATTNKTVLPCSKGSGGPAQRFRLTPIKAPAASNGVSNLQRCRAAGYLTLAAVAKYPCKHGYGSLLAEIKDAASEVSEAAFFLSYRACRRVLYQSRTLYSYYR